MANSTGRLQNQYTSLEPRIKILSESTIQKRWKKLPVTTQSRVADLLMTIKRSALLYGDHERKSVEVQGVVSEIIDQLIHLVPRMPFPPGTDESAFDFEGIINRQRMLEEQLTSNTHTVELLRVQAEAEAALLNKERAELESLEQVIANTEAVDEKRERLHLLARDDNEPPSLVDYEVHSIVKAPGLTLFDLENDSEARELIRELRRHVDNVENTSEAPNKISSALSSSQAALDVFNWKKLRDIEYRQVYKLDEA